MLTPGGQFGEPERDAIEPVLDAIEDALDLDELHADCRGLLAALHDDLGSRIGYGSLRAPGSTIGHTDAAEYRFWHRLAMEATRALADIAPEHPHAADMEEIVDDLRRGVCIPALSGKAA